MKKKEQEKLQMPGKNRTILYKKEKILQKLEKGRHKNHNLH